MAANITLFDHLKNLHTKSTQWSEMTTEDKKTFSPYVINRFLSMNADYLELVNYAQRFYSELVGERLYKFYMNYLPNRYQFHKFIKSVNEEVFSNDLIELIARHFSVSKFEATDYIKQYLELNKENDLIDIIKMYGKSDSDIKEYFNKPKKKTKK